MIEVKDILAEGKAKTMHTSTHDDYLIMTFRDDISAFNGEKVDVLEGKGEVNHRINKFLMEYLSENGIKTCYVQPLNETQCVVQKLQMVPVECVVRNVSAGSFAKRFGLPTGTELTSPIFELFYKSDALGDPMVRDEHVVYFEWATEEEIAKLKSLSIRVNALLDNLFRKAGLRLVDFKLEFGKLNGEFILADELSPDGFRIWEKDTRKIFDKDRYRQGLGEVVEHYRMVADRLGVPKG